MPASIRIFGMIVLAVASSLCGCATTESLASEDFPVGQCRLQVERSDSGNGKLYSNCHSPEAFDPRIVPLLERTPTFYQRDLSDEDKAVGSKLIAATLDFLAREVAIPQSDGTWISEGERLALSRPAVVFISNSEGHVRVTFSGGSDAVVMGWKDDGTLFGNYVIY